MRKASRLFEIIQILRLARSPVTGAELAERLEVALRSIYRDIAALQAMRVPIEGERGIGYVLRPGFNLPPLMFSVEEAEAIALGMALIERTGDAALAGASKQVVAKIAAAVPPPLRPALSSRALHAWGAAAPPPENIDLATIRGAIRDEAKLRIDYCDEQRRTTSRVIRPIALIYYSEAATIVAWCELRQAIRHFRADRVSSFAQTGDRFRNEGDALRAQWMAGWRTGAAEAAG